MTNDRAALIIIMEAGRVHRSSPRSQDCLDKGNCKDVEEPRIQRVIFQVLHDDVITVRSKHNTADIKGSRDALDCLIFAIRSSTDQYNPTSHLCKEDPNQF